MTGPSGNGTPPSREGGGERTTDTIVDATTGRTAGPGAAARAGLLEVLTAAFGAALTPEAVVRVVLEHAVPAVGAKTGIVLTRTADGRALAAQGSFGYTPELTRRLAHVALDATLPVATAVREGRPVWVEDRTRAAQDYPELVAVYAATGNHATATLPLRDAAGAVVGALAFNFREPRPFNEDTRAFLEAVAGQCAQALERAHLFAAERAARVAAEAARLEAEAARAQTAGVLDAVADAYFALDRDFRLVAVNPAMVRGSGLAREALLGRVFWEAFPAAVSTAFERHYRAAATEGREAHFTHDYSDGRLDLVVDVDAYPAPGDGVAVFWRDVTARARADAERTRLLADTAAANAALTAANGQLQGQREELEQAYHQLQEQAAELEAQAEELQATAAHLEEQVEAADRSAALLRASEARYRALLDSVDVGFCVIQVLFEDGRAADYRFLETNAAFARQGGFGDPAGRTMREIAPDQGDAHAFWYATYGQVALDGAPAHVRQDAPALGRVYDVFAYRVDDPALRHVAVLFTDITADAEAARERERLLTAAENARAAADTARRAAEAARTEADRANRAKSEFLATMSHELRTPLNAIGGYTQLLELGIAGPTTPAQRDYLTRLAASGRHLLGLVNDVLDLAKVDAGELTVARAPATTEAAVTAALDLVRPQAVARGVALVDGNPHETTPYVGDEHRVRQVLVNLLSNAVKFTPASGSVTVTCGLAPDTPPEARLAGAGPWAFLRVADTGVGIPAAEHAAVFEPFHQVEQGHTRTQGGTGLGLAISRRLARLMGGDLTLESALGTGSTFTLWLPAVGGAADGEDGAEETTVARVVRAAHARPGLVRGLGELGDLLRRQLDAVVEANAARLRAEPGAPLARGMQQAELEDHIVTALADLAQSLVIVGEAGRAEVGLLADSVAINTAIAERHGARRLAQGWDEAALRADYAALREVLARAVRADARAGGADAEAALAVLLHFVDQSEARGVAAWRADHDRATPVRGMHAVAAPAATGGVGARRELPDPPHDAP